MQIEIDKDMLLIGKYIGLKSICKTDPEKKTNTHNNNTDKKKEAAWIEMKIKVLSISWMFQIFCFEIYSLKIACRLVSWDFNLRLVKQIGNNTQITGGIAEK